MNLIDFSTAPEGEIERLAWMGGLARAIRTEIDAEFQRLYFQARLKGVLNQAIDLHLHSRKKIIAMTRHRNESLGRAISNWGDDF